MEWCNAQAVLCFQAALAQSVSIGRRAVAAPLRIVFSGCLCNAQRQPETFALRQRKEWGWRRYAMFCFRLH
ncbi:hypothetical protein [Kingella sp. (in: b-proteobacteria)]|uniref:hypothetical protein n=1 Tax=Kingella sp. (in: b-proteobacteria) TaxID=2020713 RepID=UPI0026DC284B|nr:hypothetical protein [Kingella sp. (in: b-proteobacteria)]MDO4658170.1 hypothetical protein [Kingella sp. (in: b-proteobacteria)]